MRIVACPRCSRQAPFDPRNTWRPFCSERCKLIDLGNWASESYRLPESTRPAPEDEPPEA